jgi:hypothetical protein
MAEFVETVSATEAAALLGLTRERLRQLVVARELPERVVDSSRFRPRYVRAEMEAFGRATGRIKTTGVLEPMRLVVDELVLPAPDRQALGRRLPVHLRVWEREGWPPLVVIAAPIDGHRLIQVDAEAWQERVRTKFLGGASEVRWVELWPDHVSASRRDADAVYLEVRRGGNCLSFRRAHRRDRLAWSQISHAELEKIAGGEVARIPREVYTVDVVSRLLAAQDRPVVVEWDPWELRELAAAVVSVADGASRLTAGDAELALDVACFAASAARLVEERTREAAPESTSVVMIVATRLSPDTWRRLDEIAALDRIRASEHQGVPEWAREIRSRRDGIERMLAEHGDDLPWRLRESISRLRAFLPDPGLEEDFEEVAASSSASLRSGDASAGDPAALDEGTRPPDSRRGPR